MKKPPKTSGGLFFGTSVPHIEQRSLLRAPWHL
jgi:hypothetical protein